MGGQQECRVSITQVFLMYILGFWINVHILLVLNT